MGGAWLLILPLEILFVFPSVPPYLGNYRQCYRCHRPLSFQWGIPDLYSRCPQHYFQSTRNLATECNLTIIAYLTCDTANCSDGLISLWQWCWRNHRDCRRDNHKYVDFCEQHWKIRKEVRRDVETMRCNRRRWDVTHNSSDRDFLCLF